MSNYIVTFYTGTFLPVILYKYKYSSDSDSDHVMTSFSLITPLMDSVIRRGTSTLCKRDSERKHII